MIEIGRRVGRLLGAHSLRSISSWIADAPDTVSIRIGSSRSGMFSTNLVNVGFAVAL